MKCPLYVINDVMLLYLLKESFFTPVLSGVLLHLYYVNQIFLNLILKVQQKFFILQLFPIFLGLCREIDPLTDWIAALRCRGTGLRLRHGGGDATILID